MINSHSVLYIQNIKLLQPPSPASKHIHVHQMLYTTKLRIAKKSKDTRQSMKRQIIAKYLTDYLGSVRCLAIIRRFIL